MTRILVVDDEPQILRALAANLRARDYDVDVAATGEDALVRAADHPPDLVVLDLGLPGISGIEVIEGLRGWSRVPILVLSAREQERIGREAPFFALSGPISRVPSWPAASARTASE